MKYKLIVNDDLIDCDDSQSILDTLIGNEFLVEYSCKRGDCNLCVAEIINGEVRTTENQKKNLIKTCLSYPISNLEINVDLLEGYNLPKPKIVVTKIDEIKYFSKNYCLLVLRYSPSVNLEFIPGQYIDVIYKETTRSYSIASQNDDRKLKLLIRLVEGGFFSEYVRNNARIDDILRVQIPKGTFFMRKNLKPTTNLVFICNGSGIAPIISMINSSENLNYISKFKNIYLFWGLKNSDDIQFNSNIKNLKIIYALSSENKSKYIQHIFFDMNFILEKTHIYASGSPLMIDEINDKIILEGSKNVKYFYDKFY